MKIFIAAFGTETNVFAPMPTGLRSFEETLLRRGDATTLPPNLFTEALHVWRREAEARGWEVVEGLAAFAQPAGTTVQAAYESLRDELAADLAAAGPVDVVLIQMHGAMIAGGCDDCEGDTAARLREIAPDAVLGLALDLHCHLTEAMMEACDLIVTFKEYPHVDAGARAEELFALAERAAAGGIRPVMRDFDCRMVGMYLTARQPMRGFVDEMIAAEGKDGILSLSLAHGFPWGDVARSGTRMLAIADGDADAAARAAESFGRRFFALREAVCPPMPDIEAALDRAEEILASGGEGPVVLADTADNAGGGAPADATFLLRAVLERGLTGVASAIHWDPVLTRICAEAGVGARLAVRLGGKMGPMSGDPLDLDVTVRAVAADLVQPFGGGVMPMGAAVRLETDGVDIIVNDLRTQCFHPQAFEALGVNPAERNIVCVKSTNHFHAGFAPLAREVIFVAAPGAITPDFAAIPYRNRDPDYWPRVADPWGEA